MVMFLMNLKFPCAFFVCLHSSKQIVCNLKHIMKSLPSSQICITAFFFLVDWQCIALFLVALQPSTVRVTNRNVQHITCKYLTCVHTCVLMHVSA